LNDEGNLPEVSYKRALKTIHTPVVFREKQKLKSKALGTAPPEVNPEEKNIPKLS
jgi:hypothetical protein